ncbi:hypothetical protein PI125_g22202 [Phytophthora idaei]|nr:hypothetical protein PI125_g22202 [Phytophthora idaei]
MVGTRGAQAHRAVRNRYAEGEEAELLAAEQRIHIRRSFTCGSTRHLRASCPVRNQRKAPPSQASGSSRGNGDSQ